MLEYQLFQQPEDKETDHPIPFLEPFPVQPLPLAQKKLKFTVSDKGDLNFDGVLDENAYLILESAIAASKNKTKLEYELKLKEVNLTKEVDSIIIVFATCVLSMTVFFTYSFVSAISAQFQKKAEIGAIVKG